MTGNIDARAELRHAKAMVARRQNVVTHIGEETIRGEAFNNYKSMLMCLRECERHHNRAMSVVTDKTAGVVLETSMLVDNSRRWVLFAESNLRERWNATDSELQKVREAFDNV